MILFVLTGTSVRSVFTNIPIKILQIYRLKLCKTTDYMFTNLPIGRVHAGSARKGLVSFTAIADDISANELKFTDETVSSYVKALKKLFVIEDMGAWNPNLRSKTSIRASDTRYFSDSAIAAAVLGIGPDDLIADLNTFGLLFETMNRLLQSRIAVGYRPETST